MSWSNGRVTSPATSWSLTSDGTMLTPSMLSAGSLRPLALGAAEKSPRAGSDAPLVVRRHLARYLPVRLGIARAHILPTRLIYEVDAISV